MAVVGDDPDPSVSSEDMAQGQERVASRADAEVVVHPGAGHALESSFHPMFSDPGATPKSWRQTVGSPARTLEG